MLRPRPMRPKRIRFAESDWLLIEAAAAQAGSPTSSFVRQVALHAAKAALTDRLMEEA